MEIVCINSVFPLTKKIVIYNAGCRSRWPLDCWDCGFESVQGHGCLSLVIVVCCQVSATGRSLVQSSSTECGVSQCYLETWTLRRSKPTGDCRAIKMLSSTCWALCTSDASVDTMRRSRIYMSHGWQNWRHSWGFHSLLIVVFFPVRLDCEDTWLLLSALMWKEYPDWGGM